MTSSPVRILYVDDDPALARLAQKNLGRHGFEVVHAASISAGLEIYNRESFTAVVLDHHFQQGTGFHFLEELGERVNAVPILYVTGSSDAQTAIQALKGGAADYVIKTATEDFFPLLINALNQSIENARLREAKNEADRLLLAAKERAELLLAEMNHRISNSLSLVSAMIRMQMQVVEMEETKTALSETQSRIAAIGGVHRSLYSSENVNEVAIAPYLDNLIAGIRRTIPPQSELVLSVNLDPLTVSVDKAVALGVIVTELATNAIKYAYPSGIGEVRIRLEASECQSAVLHVEDDGVGSDPSEKPKGTGLGSRLIRAMAQSLGAEVLSGQGADGIGTHVRLIW